jgi:hypothetical protein
MAIDAESFYQTMAKPEPGADERLLAVAKLVVQEPDPAAKRGPDEAEAAARRFYGHPEAQDRVEPAGRENVQQKPEATQRASDDAQREHEEQRQAEADRANSLYDLPMDTDGPRFDEPDLDHRFEVEIPDDLAVNLQPGEAQQIGQALVAAGLGLTGAASFMKMGVEASRRGALTDDQVQQRNAAGMDALTAKWGSKAGEKIQLARGMINAAEAKWPGVKAYLNATGLGSDPRLIQQLVARAERRPGRK